MFARSQRIGKGAEIIATLRTGRRWNAPAITCSFVSKPATLGRIAVIVDTKVSKQAVIRNLLKRRVRAAVREIGLPPGDLVIRVWKGALVLNHEQLKQQLQQCLSKVSKI